MLRRATLLVMVAGCLAMAACTSTSSEVRGTSTGTTIAGNAPAPEPAPPTTVPRNAGGGSGPSATSPASEAPSTAPRTCQTIPLSTAGPTQTTSPTTIDPNGAGIGDSLFPDLGNPGIDVQHYDVALNYDPTTKDLGGVVTASVLFTQTMVAFDLDAGPSVTVSNVSVDSIDATFAHDALELRITPTTSPASGSAHVVSVTFTVDKAGRHSNGFLSSGWFDTKTGSYDINEPDGGRLWLPSNDHPSDKATWTFTIHVPTGTTAIANGAMTSHQSSGGTDAWTWQETRPMASYLVQVITGPYDIVDSTGPHGLPLISAVLTADRTKTQPYIDAIGEEISFFERYFGPFPLDRYGIAITDSDPGLAMEEQERSLFSREDLNGEFETGQQLLLSHELAHQWFGDAVSPARWQDVWLNESFATYGEWMWLDHLGVDSLDESAAKALKNVRMEPTAEPTLEGLFTLDVYDNGAVALQALRRQIGDDHFFSLLQQWVSINNGTSRTTEDFIALAQTVSGQDLAPFFQQWLYTRNVPRTLPC